MTNSPDAEDAVKFSEVSVSESKDGASDVEAALEEINAITCKPPTNLDQYQNRFADGLPRGFEPDTVAFFDDRNRLSNWFPRLNSTTVPSIDTEVLELSGGEREQLLEDNDIGTMHILMAEDPGIVLSFFGTPDFDAMQAFVEDTDTGTAFLRGDYKSATNLGNTGNYIETPSKTNLAGTVMHQLQDRIMANMPLFSPIAIRERLDLDFYPSGHSTLHPEVRFFIADGEVLYHFPRVSKQTFAEAENGVEHYQRVVDSINENIDQLYDWAFEAAQEFSDASWSLDFVMDTDGRWTATDMALNGLYYSQDKDRWHNLSEHQTGGPYNLEEQLGEAFPEPEITDKVSQSR